ncbi:hypothetical protein JTB14_020525 [Gonioctena quinquepunctata]|nr:hypothetical protein JTB14_020525 [Gonioctena quinquepunctata]
MKEQKICCKYSDKIWATQKTATQVLIESERSNTLLQLESHVIDIAVSENILAFTNGRKIEIYGVTWIKDNILELNSMDGTAGNDMDFSIKKLSTLSLDNEGININDMTLLAINSKCVSVYSSTGSLLASITSGLKEGEPIGMDVTSQYLTIFTMEGYLKIYDVVQHQPKLTTVKNMFDVVSDFGEIMLAKTNCAGNKVALTLAAANLIPDGKLYICDIEKDNINVYDLKKYDFWEKTEREGEKIMEHNDKNSDEIKSAFDTVCRNRVPINYHWDKNDPRLLVCTAKKLKIPGTKMGLLVRSKSTTEEKKKLEDEDLILITMFVSPENLIKIHDIRAISLETQILACSTPFIVTLQKLSIIREVMNDFIGLESCDKSTRDAILDFSYNISLGNMDAAFKAIKLVQSPGIWGSLARMCVKTRRLDVAGVCLGHMANAKAARALKQAMMDESLPHEGKVAVLAVHLSMLDEAEQLFIQCGRYDLQNNLLRSRNKMDAAHAVAESKDRINLRNTEHAWAESLELLGDLKEACARYERANTHLYDVPRMLSDYPQQLQAYMSKTKDKDMMKWWGQYVESQGDMLSALKIYAKADDTYSQVRVLCFLGKESVAADLARSNCDKAAFYHMARYYETLGNYEEAVNFYTRKTT